MFFFKLNDLNFIQTTIDMLYNNFGQEIESGLIEIVVPFSIYYPNFNEFNVTDEIFHEPNDRIKWRTKHNYDISYLMNYCQNRSQYYLQVLVDLNSDNFIKGQLKLEFFLFFGIFWEKKIYSYKPQDKFYSNSSIFFL